MIDQTAQKSRELFESGLLCAESVLFAVAQSKGIESNFIPNIATGFCGGIARTCGMCGAVSGAIMAIGLFTGRRSPEDSRDETYSLVRRLLEMFEAKFGSTNCGQLTGCDLGTEEGQEHFRTNNLLERCKLFTEEATRMAMSLVKEKPGQ
jgi:C_GCAxxG_C_C family probable redox protein